MPLFCPCLLNINPLLEVASNDQVLYVPHKVPTILLLMPFLSIVGAPPLLIVPSRDHLGSLDEVRLFFDFLQESIYWITEFSGYGFVESAIFFLIFHCGLSISAISPSLVLPPWLLGLRLPRGLSVGISD